MIGSVSNIVRASDIGEVKLQAVKAPKTLPKVNSFVKIDVLENTKGNFKILVDGNLFQSKLPVKAKAGDSFFAQVLSHNPLTLSLDSFSVGKAGEAAFAAAVLAKLGLAKTESAEKFINVLLKTKKTLSKEKLKESLEFISHLDGDIDELQFAFIAAYFWDDNGETYAQKKSIYRRVFDLDFNRLCEAVYKKIVWLSVQNLETEFYETLKNKMIFNHEKFDAAKSLNALFGKVKNAIELADYLEQYARKSFITKSVAKEIFELRELLIKYVLQKSLLNKYGLYADFAITLSAEGLHLWRFEYTKTADANGESVFILKSAVANAKSEKIDAKIFITEKKVQGEIAVEGKRNLLENIKTLNEKLSGKLKINVNVRPYGEQFLSV